jgi:hypothetical protein
MDHQHFDRFAQIVATAQTRRGALRLLLAAAAGAVVPVLAATEAHAGGNGGRKKKKKKKGDGAKGSDPVDSPTGTAKQLRETCTPGTDTCANNLQCSTPTTRHTCSSTVQGKSTWCCVPPGGSCTECDCCGDNYCEFDNNNKPHCVPNPEG